MYVIQHCIIITSAKMPCCIEIQYQITLKIIDIVYSEGVQSIMIENPMKMINTEWIGKIYTYIVLKWVWCKCFVINKVKLWDLCEASCSVALYRFLVVVCVFLYSCLPCDVVAPYPLLLRCYQVPHTLLFPSCYLPASIPNKVRIIYIILL